jgi:hypothetical protein
MTSNGTGVLCVLDDIRGFSTKPAQNVLKYVKQSPN